MIFKLSSEKEFCHFVRCLKVFSSLVSSKTWGERVGWKLRELGDPVKLNFCVLSCWNLSARGMLRRKKSPSQGVAPESTEDTLSSCLFWKREESSVSWAGASGPMTTDLHKVKSLPLIVTFAQRASSEAKLFLNVRGPVVPFGLKEPIIEMRFGQSSQSQPPPLFFF